MNNTTTIRPNNGHKYAQSYVAIYPNDTVVMVSYTTPVIEITPEGWLHVNGLYSMTTIRHIGWFMRERGMTYQLAKRLYTENKEINVYSRKIRDRA
jgi:hypothetical protein